jgi:hypothetical protein
MSREIDLTKKSFSDDELAYLAQRDQLPAHIAEKLGPEGIAALMPVADERILNLTGTAASDTDVTQEEYEAVLAMRAEKEAAGDAERASKLPQPVAIVGEYGEGWTNETRRNELEKRGLETEGNKEELINRLQQSDRDDGAIDEEDLEDDDAEDDEDED